MTWAAMLFSAGIGIDLIFFCIAEPVTQFLAPPDGDPATVAAARRAMELTFLHWGLSGWGVYTLVGMSLAFFSYRHGLPLTIRSALYPIFGKRIHGPLAIVWTSRPCWAPCSASPPASASASSSSTSA